MKKYISTILLSTVAIIAISPHLVSGNTSRQWRAWCRAEQKNIGGWTHYYKKAVARRDAHKVAHPRHRMMIRTRRHR